jgi:hypothetical protein
MRREVSSEILCLYMVNKNVQNPDISFNTEIWREFNQIQKSHSVSKNGMTYLEPNDTFEVDLTIFRNLQWRACRKRLLQQLNLPKTSQIQQWFVLIRQLMCTGKVYYYLRYVIWIGIVFGIINTISAIYVKSLSSQMAIIKETYRVRNHMCI